MKDYWHYLAVGLAVVVLVVALVWRPRQEMPPAPSGEPLIPVVQEGSSSQSSSTTGNVLQPNGSVGSATQGNSIQGAATFSPAELNDIDL